MSERYQFSLSSLLILTAMCAVVLAVARLIDPLFAIVVSTVPFCLIAERVLGGRNTAQLDSEGGTRAVRIVGLLLCALSVACAAWISIIEGNPTLVSPLPLLVVLPYFVELGIWGQQPFPWLACGVVPVLTFLILSWPVTRAHFGVLPWQFPILLSLTTVFSVGWFANSLGYSIEHNAPAFTIGMCVANALFAAGLWLGWHWQRRGASFGVRLALCTVLHYWLFWCAFPWLGELF